jgi:hypothetical protein
LPIGGCANNGKIILDLLQSFEPSRTIAGHPLSILVLIAHIFSHNSILFFGNADIDAGAFFRSL